MTCFAAYTFDCCALFDFFRYIPSFVSLSNTKYLDKPVRMK
jgi:hypothetical protein